MLIKHDYCTGVLWTGNNEWWNVKFYVVRLSAIQCKVGFKQTGHISSEPEPITSEKFSPQSRTLVRTISSQIHFPGKVLDSLCQNSLVALH